MAQQGFSLRALLNDDSFMAGLNSLHNNDNSTKQRLLNDDVKFSSSSPLSGLEIPVNSVSPSGVPEKNPNPPAVDPSSAYLLNKLNIWDEGGNDGDFNLEYMDLDEFLTETGLGSTVVEPALSTSTSTSTSSVPSPAVSQIQAPSPPVSENINSSTAQAAPSQLEALLRTVSPTCPPIEANPSKSSIITAEDPVTRNDSVEIVKKRKYSEDGESLDDTSVVVVPGKDGFDPTRTKFRPDELRPQPIIKKSKKTFVPDTNKDEKYWKRRNKNNVAAKRSRDARRAKENQIIMRASFLEEENERLTADNEKLIAKNKELQEILKKFTEST